MGLLRSPWQLHHSLWANAQLRGPASLLVSNSSSAQALNLAAVTKPSSGMTYANKTSLLFAEQVLLLLPVGCRLISLLLHKLNPVCPLNELGAVTFFRVCSTAVVAGSTGHALIRQL